MKKTSIYVICDRKGKESCLFLKDSVVKRIGLERIADCLRANMLWYWPLGEIEAAPKPSEPDHFDARLEQLVDKWLEAGAPIVKGAIGMRAKNCTPKFVRRYLLYKYSEEDRIEKLACVPTKDVQKCGREALEADLAESTVWYYCIGEAVGMKLGKRLLDPHFSTHQMTELVDSWRQKGSPKEARKIDRERMFRSNPGKGAKRWVWSVPKVNKSNL
jgi:hypothetical protein